MADFERKLTMLAERGIDVGPEEMIERVEAQMAEDPLVVVTKQRKGWGMSVNTGDKQERKRRSTGKGLAWAAAAFVAVIGIGVLYLALGDGGESGETVAAPGETASNTASTSTGQADMAPVEVAEALALALQDHDVDAAREILADGAIVDLAAIQSADLLEAQRDYWLATGWVFTLEDCVEVDLPTVQCSLVHENDWTRAVERGPYAGSSYLIDVRDGKAISIVLEFDGSTGFSRDGWEPFQSWVESNHDEDLETMYDGTTFKYDEEAIALWKRYTEEYVAQVVG